MREKVPSAGASVSVAGNDKPPRRIDYPELCAIAFDHRVQLERLADRLDQPRARIPDFKMLIYRAARAAFGQDRAFGILLDDRYGNVVLEAAKGRGHWIARPVELPERRPLVFEHGPDIAETLRQWPIEHVAKCLVYQHPIDAETLQTAQEQQLGLLFDACNATGRELLIEVIPDKNRPGDAAAVCAILQRFYALGLRPDWWKLAAPETEEGWQMIDATIRSSDPACRGVLLLGLDAPEGEFTAAFTVAGRQPICKGFAIGRSIFFKTAESWFSGQIDDDTAVERIAAAYGRLIGAWRQSRSAS
jgi:5-dehydro-2-deoxygluconokinase